MNSGILLTMCRDNKLRLFNTLSFENTMQMADRGFRVSKIGLALVLAQIQTYVPQVPVREQYMYGARIAAKCCDNCKSMVARFMAVHGELMGHKLRLLIKEGIVCCE